MKTNFNWLIWNHLKNYVLNKQKKISLLTTEAFHSKKLKAKSFNLIF